MDDKMVNNSIPIPSEEHTNFDETVEGQVETGTDNLDNLEPEQIEELLRKQSAAPEVKEKVEKVEKVEEKKEEVDNTQELLDALKDEQTDTETGGETSENLPEKLKGKTLEQIAEMYVNAEKLNSTHSAELGELRKQKGELATAKELAKKYELEMSAAKVTPTLKKWTPTEVADFIQKLGEDPQGAFASLINPYIKPLGTSVAQTRNERMEDTLIKENADKVVPYNHEAVDTILKANPELWKEHGTKAIKIAFNMYKEEAFPTLMEAKEKAFMDELQEKKNNKDKEQATHIMGVGTAKTKVTNTGNMQKAIAKLDKMDPDKALEILGKVLKYSS